MPKPRPNSEGVPKIDDLLERISRVERDAPRVRAELLAIGEELTRLSFEIGLEARLEADEHDAQVLRLPGIGADPPDAASWSPHKRAA